MGAQGAHDAVLPTIIGAGVIAIGSPVVVATAAVVGVAAAGYAGYQVYQADVAGDYDRRDYYRVGFSVCLVACVGAKFGKAPVGASPIHSDPSAQAPSTASSNFGAMCLSVEQAGASLAKLIGFNRISVMTRSGRVSIDLAGKPNFDKSLGQNIPPPPHLKFQQLYPSPSGMTDFSPGTVRSATMSDIRTARNIFQRR